MKLCQDAFDPLRRDSWPRKRDKSREKGEDTWVRAAQCEKCRNVGTTQSEEVHPCPPPSLDTLYKTRTNCSRKVRETESGSWQSWLGWRGWQMIICKRPVPPDNNLQKARPSGWSFARGQPCGQPHGWTDGPIKSSTRGPRGPKKTKQRKQSSYTNKRKNLYFFIAGHLYSALLLLINANKKHWNIHIS